MLTATVNVWLDKGNMVARKNVTPAEVQLLCIEHKGNAGRIPVDNIRDIKEQKDFVVSELGEENGKQKYIENKISWTMVFEKRRLRAQYGKKKTAALFPINAQLPTSFEEALASVVDSDEEELVTSTALKQKHKPATMFVATAEGDKESSDAEMAEIGGDEMKEVNGKAELAELVTS